MLTLATLLLLPGQFDKALVADFPRETQVAALAATVQVVNPARKASGSGVVLGRNGPVVYILTARHLVEGAERLEVSTFAGSSYPKPQAVHRTARVEALAEGPADLALVRLTTTEDMPGTLRLCPARLLPAGQGFAGLTVGCDGEAPRCQAEKVAGKTLVRRQARGPGALFWEIDRKQAEGRSGGPLVDGRGFLLGVCSGTSREKSYYCHADEVRAFLKRQGLRWLVEQDK